MKKNIFRALFVSLLALGALFASLPVQGDTIWQEQVFGENLLPPKKGLEIPSKNLENKIVGVYFSAHWCGPCRKFTPELVKFRNKLVQEKKHFEVVFVSSDRRMSEMVDYIHEAKMPWPSVPYDSAFRTKLQDQFHIKSIPTLIILDKNGKVITKKGREEVTRCGIDAYDYWKKGKAAPSIREWNDGDGPLKSKAQQQSSGKKSKKKKK